MTCDEKRAPNCHVPSESMHRYEQSNWSGPITVVWGGAPSGVQDRALDSAWGSNRPPNRTIGGFRTFILGTDRASKVKSPKTSKKSPLYSETVLGRRQRPLARNFFDILVLEWCIFIDVLVPNFVFFLWLKTVYTKCMNCQGDWLVWDSKRAHNLLSVVTCFYINVTRNWSQWGKLCRTASFDALSVKSLKRSDL